MERQIGTTMLTLVQGDITRQQAFPSISTGAFRFAIDKAAAIAIETIGEHCRDHPDAHDEVRMVLFSAVDLEVYTQALRRSGGGDG